MKTDKYNSMISSFQCDFSLALEGDTTLSEIAKKIEDKDKRLLNDIDLLEELEWNLRNGKVEIHIINK